MKTIKLSSNESALLLLFLTGRLRFADNYHYKTDKKERQALRDLYADAYPAWEKEENDKDLQQSQAFAREFAEITRHEDPGLPLGFKEE